MNNLQTVQIAAWISARSVPLIESGLFVPGEALQRYARASHQRVTHWLDELRVYPSRDRRNPAAPTDNDWPRMRALLAEIFATEVLTRVASGLLTVLDTRRQSWLAESICHPVLVSHQEARYQSLRILEELPDTASDEAARLNRFRAYTDRWSDMLLAPLAARWDVERFSVDPHRAADFAHTLTNDRHNPHAVFLLNQASVERTFHGADLDPAFSRSANRRVASCILSCLQLPRLPDEIPSGPAFSYGPTTRLPLV